MSALFSGEPKATTFANAVAFGSPSNNENH